MKLITKLVLIIGALYGLLAVVGFIKKPGSVYSSELSEQNPFEGKRVRFVSNSDEDLNADGVRGHLEIVHTADREKGWILREGCEEMH